MKKTTAVVKAGETWARKDGTYRAFINRVSRGRAYFTTLPAGISGNSLPIGEMSMFFTLA